MASKDYLDSSRSQKVNDPAAPSSPPIASESMDPPPKTLIIPGDALESDDLVCLLLKEKIGLLRIVSYLYLCVL